MLPALEMLRGEALLHGGGAGPHGLPAPCRIKHFPLATLPADAPGRFAALFAERARWEWEDLAPYIQVQEGGPFRAQGAASKGATLVLLIYFIVVWHLALAGAGEGPMWSAQSPRNRPPLP